MTLKEALEDVWKQKGCVNPVHLNIWKVRYTFNRFDIMYQPVVKRLWALKGRMYPGRTKGQSMVFQYIKRYGYWSKPYETSAR